MILTRPAASSKNQIENDIGFSSQALPAGHPRRFLARGAPYAIDGRQGNGYVSANSVESCSTNKKPFMSETLLFAGPNQPARRSFDILDVTIDGQQTPVSTRDVLTMPFCVMVEFVRTDIDVSREILVVAPLSGQFPIMLRDFIVGLLPWFRVYVTDWINVRHVGIEQGHFGLETNIDCVLQIMTRLKPGSTVVALCQAGVPALAATAVLAATHNQQAPRTVVLIAAPIDPLANPTRVAQLLRAQSLTWMQHVLTTTVPEHFEGRGRRVYPADVQLLALWAYLARRIGEGGQMLDMILRDVGSDPHHFPFLDLYTSIMDLDGRYFLENTRSLYQDYDLKEGTMRFHGALVDLRTVREARLLTIEGEWDDIAAPGQTSAAHQLCTLLPEGSHRSVVIPKCGHFSLFHGDTFRRRVLPEILAFTGINHDVSEAAA